MCSFGWNRSLLFHFKIAWNIWRSLWLIWMTILVCFICLMFVPSLFSLKSVSIIICGFSLWSPCSLLCLFFAFHNFSSWITFSAIVVKINSFFMYRSMMTIISLFQYTRLQLILLLFISINSTFIWRFC